MEDTAGVESSRRCLQFIITITGGGTSSGAASCICGILQIYRCIAVTHCICSEQEMFPYHFILQLGIKGRALQIESLHLVRAQVLRFPN